MSRAPLRRPRPRFLARVSPLPHLQEGSSVDVGVHVLTALREAGYTHVIADRRVATRRARSTRRRFLSKRWKHGRKHERYVYETGHTYWTRKSHCP